MATYTSYLNLEKPTTSETFNLLKMNQNWDKIDAGVSSLNSKIGNHYDGIKYGGETYINLLRSGNVVYMSCTAGLWNSNGSNQIVLNGYSSGAVVPTGFRPTFNAEIREALNGKRITVDVNGNIATNEALSSVALRFGGCWITSDAMPS